jgi:GNAT superfamily N-acetyltransferase
MAEPDKLEMIRPSNTAVPMPLVAEGYRLRARETFDVSLHPLFKTVFDGRRIHEIAGKLLPGGCFVAEHLASRRIAGFCMAFRGDRPPRHRHAGQLAYLVVDPAHFAKGLGKLLAAAVTNKLAEDGYACPFLRTGDDRRPAISIYRSLGWQPHLYAPDMDARWQAVETGLALGARRSGGP